jgi:simple sugar transport system ATP-binding protein
MNLTNLTNLKQFPNITGEKKGELSMPEYGGTPLVSMQGITKSFYGVFANKKVDFDVFVGEIHTLLGENGAGKSTLMNVLSGLYRPEEGSIRVEGALRDFRSPRDAIAGGVGMVHQHFMLVPVQTVWENMILGRKDIPLRLPRKKIIREVEELSQRYGLEVDPEAKIWQLSIGEQQRVEILRALYRGARLLVLDEPTAVLTPQEAKSLFGVMRRMAAEGHGLVFISHKLDEVMEISDRVTILRKGEKVGVFDTAAMTRESLAEKMVGRTVVPTVNPGGEKSGEVAYACRNLRVMGDRGVEKVKGLSLELRKGEIFGLAGISGNGQTELCEALAGMRPLLSGELQIRGKPLHKPSPRKILKEGVAFIPADRRGVGLIPSMNLRENVALRKYWRPEYDKWIGCLDWEAVAGKTGEIVGGYNVQIPRLGIPVRSLSGGNLQKLMLGREMIDKPQVIIAFQPTWGLDVGATQYVRRQLVEARERGAAVLLVSEDLEEVMALSDRIGIIFGGEIMGILPGSEHVEEERLGLLMAGSRLEDLERGRN